MDDKTAAGQLGVTQLREAARRAYADEFTLGQQIDRLRARQDQLALEARQLEERADELERGNSEEDR